jgi:hypothetical protein
MAARSTASTDKHQRTGNTTPRRTTVTAPHEIETNRRTHSVRYTQSGAQYAMRQRVQRTEHAASTGITQRSTTPRPPNEFDRQSPHTSVPIGFTRIKGPKRQTPTGIIQIGEPQRTLSKDQLRTHTTVNRTGHCSERTEPHQVPSTVHSQHHTGTQSSVHTPQANAGQDHANAHHTASARRDQPAERKPITETAPSIRPPTPLRCYLTTDAAKRTHQVRITLR